MNTKIKVKPEGRNGLWIPEKESVIDFLNNFNDTHIHNMLPNGGTILGCDFSKEETIKQIKESERLAIATGSALVTNMQHALAVIIDNKLSLFNIGEIEESDLLIT